MITEDYGRQVGALMRRERERRGWSLTDVEKHSGGRWLAVVIGSYERGDRHILAEALDEYARWLGVDVLTLLPAEPDSRHQIARLAADIAGKAVRELLEVLGRRDPVAAKALLTDALTHLEGSDAA